MAGRPSRRAALGARKTRSHEQNDWVKDKSKKKDAEKIKYIKDRFDPVFDDIDCMLPELIIEFFKGKNDIQLSRSKPTLDTINIHRSSSRREKTNDEIVRDSYPDFKKMIDTRLMKKIVDYPCFEFFMDDDEDENGDLLDCIKKDSSPKISTHIVICHRRNILTKARPNAPWSKACQGDKFDNNYFICSSDDEYILTKVTKGQKKFQKQDLFLMKQHFDREKKCWVGFDDSLAVSKNSCPIGIKIQFDAGRFSFKTFEKSTVGDRTKKTHVLLSGGNGQITFFKNSDYIDKSDDQSLLASILSPQTSTPKKQPEQKLPESFEMDLEPSQPVPPQPLPPQPVPPQPLPPQPVPSQSGSSQPVLSQPVLSQPGPSQSGSSQQSSQPEKTYHDAMVVWLKQESLPINFQFDGETGKIVPKLGGIKLNYDPRYSRKELSKKTHDAEVEKKFLSGIKKGAFRKELTKNPQKYQLIRLSDDQEETNKKHYQIANGDQYDYRFLEIIQVQPDEENEIYNPITGNQFYDHLKCSILKNIFSMFPSFEEHILIFEEHFQNVLQN